MSFVAAAVIGGGAALLGGAMQGIGAERAAGIQAGGADRATQAQLGMFNTINQQQAPYRQAGYRSLNELMYGLGLSNTRGVDTQAVDNRANQLFNEWDKGHIKNYGISLRDVGGEAYDRLMSAFRDRASNEISSQQPQGQLSDGFGALAHTFGPEDLKSGLAPNYDFMLDQGIRATRNAGNLQSGLLSGNTLKGIADYAENYAGNAYQNAFNNYQTQQSNIFNRLSNIAGIGQSAGQTSASAGTSLAGNAGQFMSNAGAAQAGGVVGQANAFSGGLNNAMGWFSLPGIMDWAKNNG